MARYYRDDDREVEAFVAWSMLLAGQGIVALLNALRPRPSVYCPKAPDDPTQVPPLERLTRGTTIDVSRMKLPKFDLKDLRNPKVEWNPEDRPQLIKAESNPYPFVMPVSREGAKVLRIYASPTEPNQDASVRLMEVLLQSCPRLSFEIVVEPSGTFFQIVDIENQCRAESIAAHVRTYHPTARVELLTEEPEKREYPFYRQMVVFGLSNEYAAPLPFFSAVKFPPLIHVTNRMEQLDGALDERIHYRLMTYTHSAEAGDRAGRRLLEGMVKGTGGLYKKNDPFAGMDENLINAKLDQPVYHAFLSLTVESRREDRLAVLTQSAGDITAIAQPRHNSLVTVGNQAIRHIVESAGEANLLWFETLLTTLVRRRVDAWRKLLLVLSPEELATLWHVPDERFTASRIVWNQVGIAKGLTKASEQGVCIGDSEFVGRKTPIYVTPAERIHHTMIVGKTGTGKSTLIRSLVEQDIAAGRGVVVIDPVGELTHAILASSIPQARQRDVLVLDCGNSAYPVPLNPFRIPPGVSYEYVNTYLYWVLKKIYESIWVEGRTDFTIRNVIQALLTDPEATPLDIQRLLGDDTYRDHVLDLLEDNDDVAIAVSQYWEQFTDKSTGERSEIAGPIIHRTGTFINNRALELMTCHPRSLDFKQLLTEGKILLINLSGDAIKTEANNLGAILLAHLYLAGQSLGKLKDGDAPRSFVYVDEADRFVSSPLPDMFAEARKYGLAMTLATQYLDRLPQKAREGIFGNAGAHYVFEVGLDDARALEEYVAPLTRQELINLGLHRMLVKTRSEGESQPAFLVQTRPVPDDTNPPFRDDDPTFGGRFLSKAEVAAWLRARYPKRSRRKPGDKPETDTPRDAKDQTLTDDGLTDYE